MTGGFPPEISVWLRPNALATGLLEDDLLACLLPGITGIVLPKSRAPAEATLVDGVLRTLERAREMDEGSVRLALLIETPQAVLGAAETGLPRTASNDEVREARAHVALAAHGSGRDAIDIVHTAVRDLEGLARECREGKALGYTGKQVIHPA